MTLQLIEKIDVYKVGLGSLKRYMDRLTTDLFEKMSQAVNDAMAVGEVSSAVRTPVSQSSEPVTSADEYFGKYFRHENLPHESQGDLNSFDEINRLRGNVNQLEVLHAKLQYMMVELESLAKRAY